MSYTLLTDDGFENEIETESFFDSKINPVFFTIEKQVKGRRLFDDKCTDLACNGQNIKLDRILHPTAQVVKAGWRYGPVGVELKKSKIALGGVITQVLEQRQTLFLSRFLNNTRILPSIFAIFPVSTIKGDIHSLMNTQLILACSYRQWTDSIRFSNGNFNILEIGKDICINENWQPSTCKGHRGLQK